jgi:Uma2 family endonuclease
MEEFMANGVKLGWLIDADKCTVTIYRQRRKPETLLQPKSVKGEGPVAGFVLDLEPVWDIE